MKVRVYITVKQGVLDPQGKAVESGLKSLSFGEVKGVRVGKFIELDLNGVAPSKIEERVKQMCEKLLANPVIESYRVEIGTHVK